MQQKLHNEKKTKANCPFQPKVNTTSKLIVDSSDKISSMSFIERQMAFKKMAIFNKIELQSKIMEEQDITFTPDIGSAESVILQKPELRERYARETAHDRSIRLSKVDFERKQQKQLALQKKYNGR